MISELKLYGGLATAAILAFAFTWWSVHERGAGEQKIEKQDSTALAVVHKEVVAETAANIAKADTADLGADHDQQVIDAYRAAHPEQPVRLCHNADSRIAGVSEVKTSDGSAQGAGAGSAAVREVQEGTPGPDIGPGLDALVQAAGRLAVIDRDRQRRQPDAEPVK